MRFQSSCYTCWPDQLHLRNKGIGNYHLGIILVFDRATKTCKLVLCTKNSQVHKLNIDLSPMVIELLNILITQLPLD